MQTWSVLAAVKDPNGFRYSTLKTEIEAEGVEEAQTKILTWLRKRLKRFSSAKKRFVFLQANPWVSHRGGRVLDADMLLRLRPRFSSISSIQKVGEKKLFVVGYGPKQAEELNQ